MLTSDYFKIIWADVMVKDLILNVGDIILYPDYGYGKVTLTDKRIYPKVYADVVFWDGQNKFPKDSARRPKNKSSLVRQKV